MMLAMAGLQTTRLMTWNVVGRVKMIPAQVGMITSRRADIVALQEVRSASLPSLWAGLRGAGLGQIVESFSLAPDPTALRGPRAYGELIASRWPVEPLSPEAFKIPWRERVLSATVTTPTEPIEVHTTHIPAGVTNAWIKIDTLEGIFDRLACPVGGSQGPVRGLQHAPAGVRRRQRDHVGAAA